MKVAELLDILKITKQSLGRVLKQLVDQGYVVQKEGANDRRQRLLYVTAKGESAGDEARRPADRAHRGRARRARAQRARGRAPLPGQHDRRRQPRRRAAVHRARRPRAAPALLRERDASGGSHASNRRASEVAARTTRRICWWSTTTAAFAICCRASCTAEGYRVTTAESAAEARAKLDGLRFDLLILDVMMPGETGFEFARKLRTSSNVPILMLTARGEAESRIQGLEIGADDYVGKPFEPRELALRIASILKRARPAAAPPVEFVRFGDFVFHLARGELKRGDEVVHLTDREREMLRAAGRAVPARRCRGWRSPAARATAATAAIGERAVDVQINRLRRKIERDPANPLLRADRARRRLPAGGGAMTALDTGIAALRSAAAALRSVAGRALRPLRPRRQRVQER